MIPNLAAHTGPTLATLDWLVIGAYLLVTTLLGARLAGKQATIRDFFLGGRKLPWWAVSGSIIATEISAVTFIGAPVLSFTKGGNLTYLQLGVGALLARIVIGVWFVPQYYKREIFSPYDYLGKRLGPRVKKSTTLLFFVGAILGQGARVYVTAFLLSVIANIELSTSIWLIGLFSITWTLLGGITTVIWTDVIQFCLLVIGGIVALCYAIHAVAGGGAEVLHLARDAGKLTWFDPSLDLSREYTIWAGLFAFSILNLAAFGLDQVMAQRMFCCKNASQARLAIIVSSAGQLVAVLMLAVGIALYAYFIHNPMTPGEASQIQTHPNYLFPIFITRALPVGIRGLIIAAVFAAAISSLDSALAALAQTTVSAFKKPVVRIVGHFKARRKRQISDIRLSKILVVFWGLVLCLMANACIAISDQYANVINLALGLTAYTYGPLLGIFLLAFLPIHRDDAGLSWAIPMTMLAVFGISVHVDPVPLKWLNAAFNWADWMVWLGAATCLVLTLIKLKDQVRHATVIVICSLAIVLLHHYHAGYGKEGEIKYLSFAWSFPLGTVMTFIICYALGRPAQRARRGKKTNARSANR